MSWTPLGMMRQERLEMVRVARAGLEDVLGIGELLDADFGRGAKGGGAGESEQEQDKNRGEQTEKRHRGRC